MLKSPMREAPLRCRVQTGEVPVAPTSARPRDSVPSAPAAASWALSQAGGPGHLTWENHLHKSCKQNSRIFQGLFIFMQKK